MCGRDVGVCGYSIGVSGVCGTYFEHTLEMGRSGVVKLESGAGLDMPMQKTCLRKGVEENVDLLEWISLSPPLFF